MKVRSFLELGPLQKAMVRRAAAEAAAIAAARAVAEREDRERRLFELAVGPVQALRAARRVQHTPEPLQPQPFQRLLDERSVMREALSDEFDVETLLHTDDLLSYRVPRLGPDV